ncbi:MAG: hypothetical protein GVY12_16870 [Bacteroidetes bacterium]|jgi:hypothetical protein|nr:hypothetical protein [Bacteroidota bacterium]
MLNPDYRDILSAFDDAGVEYLVIGAYAVAAHGHPRATGDIDLWVRPSPVNAKRVLRALKAFGAPLSNINEQDFQAPGLVFQIGVAPRRIDILTTAEGLTFDVAWRDRVTVNLEGVPIPVLSKAHLIQNKRALGRHQDLADIEHLGGETES